MRLGDRRERERGRYDCRLNIACRGRNRARSRTRARVARVQTASYVRRIMHRPVQNSQLRTLRQNKFTTSILFALIRENCNSKLRSRCNDRTTPFAELVNSIQSDYKLTIFPNS